VFGSMVDTGQHTPLAKAISFLAIAFTLLAGKTKDCGLSLSLPHLEEKPISEPLYVSNPLKTASACHPSTFSATHSIDSCFRSNSRALGRSDKVSLGKLYPKLHKVLNCLFKLKKRRRTMALSEHSLRFIHLSLASSKQRIGWLRQLPRIFQVGKIARATRVNLLKKLVSVCRTKFKGFLERSKLALRRIVFWIRNPIPQDFDLISLQVAGLPIVIPVLIPRHSGRSRYFSTSPPSLLFLLWNHCYVKAKTSIDI
jgi:hypothetical protein